MQPSREEVKKKHTDMVDFGNMEVAAKNSSHY